MNLKQRAGVFLLLGLASLVLLLAVLPPLAFTVTTPAGYLAVGAGVVFFYLIMATLLVSSKIKRIRPDEASLLLAPGVWIAPRLGIVGRKSCGCLYSPPHSNYRDDDYNAPASEHVSDIDGLDADAAEEQEVWVRSEHGAKVKYKRYIERLKRCTHCGNYHYECDRDRASHEPKVWIDDPLPDSVAEANARIVEPADVEVSD